MDSYLANGGRAKDAAVEAGYVDGSAKRRGYELLRNPQVAAVIVSRETIRRAGLDIDSAELVAALWRFAKGAEEGNYPGVSVCGGCRSWRGCRACIGRFRASGGEGCGHILDRRGGRGVKVLEYQRPRSLRLARRRRYSRRPGSPRCRHRTKAGKSVGCLAWIVEEALRGPGEGATYPVDLSGLLVEPEHVPADQADARPRSSRNDQRERPGADAGQRAQLWYRSGDRPDLLYGFDSHGLVIDEASRVSEESWHAAFRR